MTSNPLLAADLFVGRDSELAEIAGLLAQGRSVVLVGGRRAGKTTLARHLPPRLAGERTVIEANAGGWELTTESTARGALLGALRGRPETTYTEATRDELRQALAPLLPVTLILDEADRVLQAGWGRDLFAYLRWLDDAELGSHFSFLALGGPALVVLQTPDAKGSPALNTAEFHYLEALGRDAVGELCRLAGSTEVDEILELGGGQAWLTTRLLAERWSGRSLDDAGDVVFDRSVGVFNSWQHQIGERGVQAVRRMPPAGVARSALNREPWAKLKEALLFARCVGVLRRAGGRVHRGPKLFFDWFLGEEAAGFDWDLAISYATPDEGLASQIYRQLHRDFRVFFAPEAGDDLWGEDLNQVLPNTYGVSSRFVLVLSTEAYVRRHWTLVEFRAVADAHPERILLLEAGALPPDRPDGLLYRGTSAGELVGLVPALKNKLIASG